MKCDVFKTEINYIKDNDLREILKELLNGLPDYFYEVPASSTGKYHPRFSLGDGGLVRHTKVAVKIANDLLNNESIGRTFNDREKDLMLIALFIHDGFKHGKTHEKYVRFDHPLISSEYVKNSSLLNEKDREFISSVIASHMGQWNTSPYSNVTLPIPSNRYERFVHMCDFLSSKIYLDVCFNGNEIVDTR